MLCTDCHYHRDVLDGPDTETDFYPQRSLTKLNTWHSMKYPYGTVPGERGFQ